MILRHRRIAVELIAQQNNMFADKLISLFEELYAFKSAREAQASKACATAVDTIMKYTGLKIDLMLDTDNPPMCMPLMANTRHVLSTLMIDDLYDEQTNTFAEAIKKSVVKTGTIDLKNGKLGGIYSTIVSPVWMSFYFCKGNFTPRETVAVLLHELGHCFLAFEFMYRTLRASQLMANLHQVRTKRDTSITYEHALELAGIDLTGNPKEFVDCVTMDNETAITSVVFTRTYQKLANDLGDNAVAAPNFEALSDNFSAKWGCADALVTALAVFYGKGDLGIQGRFTSMVMYMGPLLATIFIGISAAVSVSLPAFGVVAFAIFMVLGVMGAGRDDGFLQQTNVYDKPYTRFARIRESVVQQLKILKLDNTQRLTLLKQIENIDAIIKGGKDVSTIMDDIAMLFESTRRADYAFKLERHLESMANNDLFIGGQTLASRA